MLKINIGSNFLGAGYQVLLQFALLPFVLNALGAEAYGLVGLFTVLSSLFSLLDFGISPALGRELSRLSAIPNSGEIMRQTVSTLEMICGAIALLIGIVLFFGSDLVARHWIPETTIPLPVVAGCLSWMGLQVAFQFMTSFYNSGLLGLQKIVLSNILQAALQTIRAAAVIVLLMTAPQWWNMRLVEQFFFLNAFMSGLMLIVVAASLYNVLPTREVKNVAGAGFITHIVRRFNVERLRACWRYAAGITATMAVVMLLTQLDKIVLSKILSLELFGFYSIASSIAIAIAKPAPLIFSAVLPRFTQLVALDDTAKLEETYLKAIRLSAWIVLPIAGIIILFSEHLFCLYLNNNPSASQIAALASILMMGYSLHSLTYVPYALSLAYGWTRYGLNISVVAVIFALPVILYCAVRYGATGAAYGWLILNIGYLIFSIRYLHKNILPSLYFKFYAACRIPAALFLLLILVYYVI
ncbi:MAG TPA: oligosaccharide flippase family protein [Smithellaceae bacterium]|nr:oligosaccharide flippase family protein [Smithellaceae bacterium]